jgi:hypothetical protein
MPSTTSYLSSMADTTQNYADTYVGFTTNLITSTFEALVQANHSQMLAYQEMVSVLSQGLSTYINETKDDVSGEEVMEFLAGLSLEKAGLLEPEQSLVYDEEAAAGTPVLGIETPVAGGSPTIASFTNVAEEIVKPPITTTFVNLIPSVVTGIKDVMITADEVSGLPKPDAALDPYAKFDAAAAGREKELAFLDLIKLTISRNKYSLLENMVETGLLRLVVDRGLIQTDFRMELSESYVDKEKTSFKHRVRTKDKTKTRSPRARGILSLFDRRPREKSKNTQKTLTVSKRKTSTTEKNNGTVSMGAKIELQFSTDYKPLILDND